MSNQEQSKSIVAENDSTEDTSNIGIDDGEHETVAQTGLHSNSESETKDNLTACNVPIVAEEIYLPNGQIMNAKTTMQSFDAASSRRVVAAAAKTRLKSKSPTNQPNQIFLPTGELINAKNTARSYNFDVENQGNMVTRNGNETSSISGSVLAEEVPGLYNPNANRHQFINELNVEAYPVQSYIVAKTEPIRPWLTKRMLYLVLIIVVISSIIIGAGVYCGNGRCTSSRPEVLPTASPRNTPTLSPMFGSVTSQAINPTTSPPKDINTKESTITAYINSITLSNRTISVNGTTAEDLALSWIINEDPIFTDIDDSIWSTLLLSSATTSSLSSTHIRLRQRYALLSLWYQQPLQTEGSSSVVHHWRNTSGWLEGENECFWYGIKCSLIEMGGFIGGQRVVTEIDFYSNDETLHGGNNITGTIPADLGLLTSLNRIDFSENRFHGTIPESILEQLVSLESINIGNNEITGTIPESIGPLSTLKILNITNNQIYGKIPESIGRCVALERFDAGGNQLTGPLPDAIGDWKLMKVFNIQDNHLNGTLPTSIGNWTALSDFYIYNNQFHGSVPDMIGEWNALKNFNIEYNMFTGTLPYSIGQLSTVRRFDVSDNMLTGAIPESIGNCTSVVFFSIEDNKFNGSIPESIGMLTSLTGLFLYGNNLTGTIPDVVGQFTSLRYMSVENNQLSGTIPSSVGNWTDIVAVQLFNNMFTGTVPNILCTFNASNITADCDFEMECDCCTHCF